MKIGIAVVALSVGLGASAASAQPGWYGHSYGYRYGSPYGDPYGPRAYYGGLPSHRVMSAVRAAGLRPVSHPMRNGRNYIIDAVDRSGDLKRVVIDGYYGQVMYIAAVTRPDYPSRRAPWTGPDGGPRPQARIPSEPEVIDRNDPTADDRDIYEEEPPMRPRARIQAGRDAIEGPSAAIPPPPAPLDRNAVRPVPAKPERKAARTNDATSGIPNKKPRAGEGESAAVNPAQPPLPRVRPGTGSGEDAVAPPKNKPAAAARTASPRVVLPGGPAPKVADAPTPASPSLDGEKPPAAATEAPAATLPPMQSLD